MRNSILRLVRPLATVAMVLGLSLPAWASETPGSYVYWNFDGVTGLDDVTYTTTVQSDPGDGSKVFWSNQVEFNTGRVAYAGMQTNGGPDRLFLFSVWDTTEFRAGSEGSFCQPFGGEGEGISCRKWQAWKAGDTYEFHYAFEGDGWWGLTVTNLNDHSSFKLGSIRVNADKLKPSSVSWIEYYNWNDARASCESEPYSRARMDVPTGNGGSAQARITGTSVSAVCGPRTNVSTTSSYAIHALAIGNSAISPLPIPGQPGLCLDATSTGRATAYACHGGSNQQWLYVYDNTLRSGTFRCLSVGGGNSVRTSDCSSGTRKFWTVSGSRVIENQSGKCLTGGSNSVTIATCNGSASQQWAVPPRQQ